jgi:hypothetical protein
MTHRRAVDVLAGRRLVLVVVQRADVVGEDIRGLHAADVRVERPLQEASARAHTPQWSGRRHRRRHRAEACAFLLHHRSGRATHGHEHAEQQHGARHRASLQQADGF